MPFTSQEAFADLELSVTRAQAFALLRNHPNGSTPEAMQAEFLADQGDHLLYSAADVLGWLGY